MEILKETRNGIQEFKFKNKTLPIKRPDNMLLLKNGNIIEIQKIYQGVNGILIDGVQWRKRDNIYRNYLINSGTLYS